MSDSKLKIWFRAIRPFSFTGSIIPVVLGAILALKQNEFHIGYFILSLIGIVMLHAGVNLLSDYDDFKNKVDTLESSGSSGVIIEKLLSPNEILKVGKLLLISGFSIALFLSYNRGWIILLFGIIGAFGGYSYTGKPFALKYKGLGAPLVFVLFGPLLVIGSYYVQAQAITFAALLVSIPVGLLTTAILHANDIRDIIYDKKAGIKTLSIIIGKSNAEKVYCGLIICSYALVFIMAFYKIIPYWSLACLITVPEAVKCLIKLFKKENNNSDIIILDKMTAKLHAQFGSVLILSILLPSIIK